MNKSLVLLIILSTIAACNSAHKNSRPDIDSTADHHLGILQISAQYYCVHGKWPHSVYDINDLQSENAIQLTLSPNWQWLKSDDVRVFSDGAKFSIESLAGKIDGDVVIARSWQRLPVCDAKVVKPVGATTKFVRQ